MFQPPSGSILLFLAKVIIIKHSVKIRRRGLFGDVAAYAATSPNSPRRRIIHYV